MRPDIERTVISIIAEQVCVASDTIHGDTLIVDDLNIDVLEIIELMTEIDERFGVRICDDDVDALRAVDQIVDYIEEQLL